MKEHSGNPDYPIWLLGDSPPENWKDLLDTPLDPRHPIRHNIWTSALDVIQTELYKSKKLRLNSDEIYIRNAIQNVSYRPKDSELNWEGETIEDQDIFKNLVSKYKPILVLTFGSFSYEFALRSLANEIQHKYGYWNTIRLAEQFKNIIQPIDKTKTNIIPLLHRSIAGRSFPSSHQIFTGSENGNYFDYVGKRLASLILELDVGRRNYFL